MSSKYKINTPFSFENDFLNNEVKKNKTLYYIYNGPFIDIGIPSDYKKAQSYLKNYV